MVQTRSRRSNLAVPGSNPRFLEKAKGLPADGYKGVNTTELVFDGYQAEATDILDGAPGRASRR